MPDNNGFTQLLEEFQRIEAAGNVPKAVANKLILAGLIVNSRRMVEYQERVEAYQDQLDQTVLPAVQLINDHVGEHAKAAEEAKLQTRSRREWVRDKLAQPVTIIIISSLIGALVSKLSW